MNNGDAERREHIRPTDVPLAHGDVMSTPANMAIAHECTNETHPCMEASTETQGSQASRRPTLCAARVTMALDRYLRAGAFSHRACFSCGSVSEPMPARQNDTHGRERRCGVCGKESALPLDTAVREGWLHVVGGDRQATVLR